MKPTEIRRLIAVCRERERAYQQYQAEHANTVWVQASDDGLCADALEALLSIVEDMADLTPKSAEPPRGVVDLLIGRAREVLD